MVAVTPHPMSVISLIRRSQSGNYPSKSQSGKEVNASDLI